MTQPMPAPEIGLTVAVVARRLGVAAATLRTWDRRYGLGPSDHSAGAHRRYTAEDVVRLDYMRTLLNSGVLASEAARAALALEVDPAAVAAVFDAATPQGEVAPLRIVPALVSEEPTVLSQLLDERAICLDTAGCFELLRDCLETRGVVWTWDQVLVPALSRAGHRWAMTGKGIEVEHTLAGTAHNAFLGVISAVTDAPVTGIPLLACAAEEQHSLPLAALAAGLAERQVAVRNLGARVPSASVVDAVSLTRANAVFLWSQTAATGMPSELEGIVRSTSATVIVGGPGWPAELPSGVHRTNDLTGAIALIARLSA